MNKLFEQQPLSEELPISDILTIIKTPNSRPSEMESALKDLLQAREIVPDRILIRNSNGVIYLTLEFKKNFFEFNSEQN